jgi:chromosome segregation ATPase
MSATEANATPNPSEDLSFEQMLQNLEGNFVQLKERYAQVQADQARQTELQQRQAKIGDRPELQTELAQLETELHELEVRLESQLFSWDSWKQYFWQTVRFLGLGVVIGWGMAFYVMKQPIPNAIEPNQPSQAR